MTADSRRPARSTIRLNAAQTAVLEWIQAGCPEGVYPDDSYTHRITARALASRGLVRISGHGASWQAELTERGRVWPEATEDDEPPAAPTPSSRPPTAVAVDDEHGGATVRAMRRVQEKEGRAAGTPSKKPRTRQVQKQETYMRYKVVVTRVQVAERWVRATDEEDAAKKAQEEFSRPYGYFGSWKDVASEVEVVEAEQTTVIRPSLLSESGPMLLSLKDAGKALGIPYSAVNDRLNATRISEVLDGRVVPPVDGLVIEESPVGEADSAMAIYVPRQPREMQPYLVDRAIAAEG